MNESQPNVEAVPKEANLAPSERLELLNRVKQYLRKVAAGTLVVSASLLPATHEEIGLRANLLCHNVAIMIDDSRAVDIASGSSSDAVNRVIDGFTLGNGFYAFYTNELTERPASSWVKFQLLTMLNTAEILYGPEENDVSVRQTEVLSALESYWGSSGDEMLDGYEGSRPLIPFFPHNWFVDDNLWMGQYFMQRYEQTGDEVFAEKAKQTIDLFISQRTESYGGGAYWQVQEDDAENQDKAMVSNVTAIPVIVDLYKTGSIDERYMQVAKDTYTWAQQLKDPKTGMFFDKFYADGTIDTTFYSYVQGEMIHAILKLHEVDPEKYSLSEAIELARVSMAHFSSNSATNFVKFNAIFIQDLIRLAAAVNDQMFSAEVKDFMGVINSKSPLYSSELIQASAVTTIRLLDELPIDSWNKI